MTTPLYYITIERVDTEQKVFSGSVRGPLAPWIEGCILEHALVIDAGKRLSARQERKAYSHAH